MAAKKKKKKPLTKKTTKKSPPRKKRKKAALAPKKKAAAKRAPKKPVAKKKPIQRRDHPGHIDPVYGKQLRARGGHSNKSDSIRPAFKVADDDVAEELGEEVVEKANSGEDEGEDSANRDYVEEVGGPFVVTTGGEEYADGTDESNPRDASVEPFPKT